MHVGYCKVYRSCFRTFGAKVVGIFILMIRQFHRNESSWNVRSRGTKVPRKRMFHGTKVLGTFAPKERKFQGANVPWNESSTGAKVLSVYFSLPGTKVQRNEKAWNLFLEHSVVYLLSFHIPSTTSFCILFGVPLAAMYSKRTKKNKLLIHHSLFTDEAVRNTGQQCNSPKHNSLQKKLNAS